MASIKLLCYRHYDCDESDKFKVKFERILNDILQTNLRNSGN